MTEKYYQTHKIDILAKTKRYYLENKEKIKEYNKQYRKTPYGRATKILETYNRMDKQSGRVKGDLTPKWIVDNIFAKPCAHCGETDWKKLGCNRLDNSKPHTMDNVEPCCKECNIKLAGIEKSIIVYQIDIVTGEILNIWQSAREAARVLNLSQSHIRECCNGGFFDKKKNKWINVIQYKGYKWSYSLMS